MHDTSRRRLKRSPKVRARKRPSVPKRPRASVFVAHTVFHRIIDYADSSRFSRHYTPLRIGCMGHRERLVRANRTVRKASHLRELA